MSSSPTLETDTHTHTDIILVVIKANSSKTIGYFNYAFLIEFQHHLGEVSHEVAAGVVCFSHNIEEERLHVIIKRLVIQKELGQKAQVLTIDL